ncbi:hypothetical protein Tco_0968504 [Tanacetum coccineum]
MKSTSLKHRLAGKKSLNKQWIHKESVSKQGRKFAKAEPIVYKDQAFDELADDTFDYMNKESAQDVGRTRNVVSEEKETIDNRVSTKDVVSTDKEEVSTDKVKVSTDRSRVSTDKEELSTDRTDKGTDAQTVGRNVELKDVENIERPRPTSTKSLLTLKPLPKIDPKDKGKKKIEEEDESDSESEGIPEAEKKFKQLVKDEEMARKVQEDWEAEEKVKKIAKEEAIKAALSNEYEFIQARMEADRLLAERLQEEEREQFTVEERAKFLHETIASQIIFLVQQRSESIRNRPPTKNQLRNQMMTYLKHVGNFKHSDLKTKKFEEIQALYEKIKRLDEDFIAIGSAEDERMIKEMNEKGIDSSKDDSVKEEVKEKEGTKKRKSGHIKMIARKKPRPLKDVDSDEEHRRCLKIVTFEGTIDSKIMETKLFISRLDKVSSLEGDYLVVYRVNGNFRAFNYLMEVLHIFDRQDLFHLYDLVMKKYSELTIEGIELILWGDLKIMMESSTEGNDQSDCLEIEQQLHEVELEAGYPINVADEEIVLEQQAMFGSGSDDSE